jgi:hypothetical protein
MTTTGFLIRTDDKLLAYRLSQHPDISFKIEFSDELEEEEG